MRGTTTTKGGAVPGAWAARAVEGRAKVERSAGSGRAREGSGRRRGPRCGPRGAAGLLSTLLLVLPVSAEGQAREADPADVGSIGALITAVYDVISGDAGEARDWDRWHTLFAEGATLSAVVRTPDGSVRRVVMTPESYVERSGAVLERDGFVEAEIGRRTEAYGLIAHAFSTYESYRSRSDTEPFTRGINSFQLMNDGTRWWVVSVYWQGESADFPIPDEYIGPIGDLE